MEKNLKQNSQKKKVNKKRKNPFRFWLYDIVKITGAIPTLLFFRIKHIYESKEAKKRAKKGVLVSANHQSYLDPVIVETLFWYRRTHMVATKELFNTKMKNWFFRNTLCFPVDKDNIGVSSVKSIIECLKSKHLVTIFPEGHVNNQQGQVDAFKSGVVLMAIKAKVPILPIYIVKREKWWKRQVVVVGEPIQIGENLNLNQINELSKTLHDKEMQLKELYSQRRKK